MDHSHTLNFLKSRQTTAVDGQFTFIWANGKLNSNLQVKSTHLTHFNEKIVVTVKGENSIVLLRDLIGINSAIKRSFDFKI